MSQETSAANFVVISKSPCLQSGVALRADVVVRKGIGTTLNVFKGALCDRCLMMKTCGDVAVGILFFYSFFFPLGHVAAGLSF